MMETVVWNELTQDRQHQVLTRPAQAVAAAVRQKAERILEDVRTRGDIAVAEWMDRLDQIQRPTWRVDSRELDEACRRLPAPVEAALQTAWDNIDRFHRAGKPEDYDLETSPGVRCETRYRGIRRVGLYVPGGRTPLPSSALMTCVPARIAGCACIVICTPPAPDGSIDPAIAWVARQAAVQDVFLLGGVQAIAAMAFGTETVPIVDKLFGPGSSWVTEAKRLAVEMRCGLALDLPAGPSEVLVIADENASPRLVAADLLAQLEHGPDSQALLVTPSRPLADAVVRETEAGAESWSRAETIRQALAGSRCILVDSLDQALTISNRYAPEHLIIQTDQPEQWSQQVTSAGSVFLGSTTPEVLGDYCSGTNHVLPTSGYAASTSGLSVLDFMKRITVQQASGEGLQRLAPVVRELANWEGLAAHARAVEIRMARQPGASS